MNLGIIGLPQAGKKTIFTILTGIKADRTPDRNGIRYGIAPVRDPRVDSLSAMYNPRRTRYAEFEIALPPDITPNSSRSADWLDPLRRVDAFIHVVCNFESPTTFHIFGDIDPERDAELVATELLFADLELMEKRLARIDRDNIRKSDAGRREREKAMLQRCKNHLEQEKPLRTLDLSEEESVIAANLQLMTMKPLITVINCSHELPEQEGRQNCRELAAELEERGEKLLFLNAAIEAEISELSPDEQETFMSELAITEPAAHRLSRAAYECLGLISFFTVGPDEVRAWPLPRGATAPAAAGRIHSDLERGFIRAETISFDQLTAAGTEPAAREANLFRLNGKDYQVKDGDVLNIRFNV